MSPRPTARNLARYGTQTSDTFGYNTRSELTSAHVNSADYSYAYDAIGNRTSATEAGTRTAYTANKLNQYTAEGSFLPTFDADGNQTLIKTSTGTWNVTYKAPEGSEGDWTMREAGLPRRGERPMGWARINAKNRPVRFEKSDNSVIVECTYDTMGRRVTKKVTTNGTLTEHRRFLYRGYLQIACCDLTRAYTPALWFITWDPTQETATRPLAIQKNGTWYTYGWDLTKNICETYRTDARIDLAYTYTPYGEVSPAHAYDQPLRWSSEYHDVELGLVYYNYRHYNPVMGRWMGRDMQADKINRHLYLYVKNSPFIRIDVNGLQESTDYEIIDNIGLKIQQHHITSLYSDGGLDTVNLNEVVTFSSKVDIVKISKRAITIYAEANAIARPTCWFSDDVNPSGKIEKAALRLDALITCSPTGSVWVSKSKPTPSGYFREYGSVSVWMELDEGTDTPMRERRISIKAESGFKEEGLSYQFGASSHGISSGFSNHLQNAKSIMSGSLSFYVACKCGEK